MNQPKATIIKGGLTVWGQRVHAGEEFVVMRRYKTTDGTWNLSLENSRLSLPMVCESKVKVV